MQLQKFAQEAAIAVLVIHHTRKAESDDLLDLVSGSFGLSGGADNVLVLGRKSNGTILNARGRDIEENEFVIAFDPMTCKWSMLGESLGCI